SVQEVFRPPLAVGLMAGGHVFPHGGVMPAPVIPRMPGNTLAVVEDLDGMVIILHLHVVADIAVRYAVVISIFAEVYMCGLLHLGPFEVPQAVRGSGERGKVVPFQVNEMAPA